METEDKKTDDAGGNNVALCASCDRCRSRKTKCDGKRPCSNCTAKYMKKHKVERYDPTLRRTLLRSSSSVLYPYGFFLVGYPI